MNHQLVCFLVKINIMGFDSARTSGTNLLGITFQHRSINLGAKQYFIVNLRLF